MAVDKVLEDEGLIAYALAPRLGGGIFVASDLS
jgi:hypothetical protein